MHSKNHIIGSVFFAVCIIALVTFEFTQSAQQTDILRIEILDVGQGDAIYIRTPKGKDILIDGSIDRHTIYELGAVMPKTDRYMDVVIATHPDADHIAGLTELPHYYSIANLWRSGAENTTGFFAALNTWEENYNVQVAYPKRGEIIPIEDGIQLEILHPVSGVYSSAVNDDSVMFILRYEEFEMLFTGDASTEIEEEIIEWYIKQGREQELDVDILKVGHHGSKTSTGNAFLNAIRPDIGVISVGAGNKFGHPHSGPLANLHRAGVDVLRTDLHGRITCTSDGSNYACVSKK